SAMIRPVASANPARRNRGTSGHSNATAVISEGQLERELVPIASRTLVPVDAMERTTVERAGSEPREHLEVRGRGVALVLPEPVLGVAAIRAHHERVPRDLREDRGSGDRGRASIARDDGALGTGHARDPEVAVDEDESGRNAKPRERRPHRVPGRL